MVLSGSWIGGVPAATTTRYEDAIARAVRLLPRPPDRIVLVERDLLRHDHQPYTEAFVNKGERTVYLVRQGSTLQGALKGPGIFDFALAAVIWHEMAHIDGADETTAQRAEERLWEGFVLEQRVERARGMQYLALLRKRH